MSYGSGIRNPHNLCYLISALQLLLNTYDGTDVNNLLHFINTDSRSDDVLTTNIDSRKQKDKTISTHYTTPKLISFYREIKQIITELIKNKASNNTPINIETFYDNHYKFIFITSYIPNKILPDGSATHKTQESSDEVLLNILTILECIVPNNIKSIKYLSIINTYCGNNPSKHNETQEHSYFILNISITLTDGNVQQYIKDYIKSKKVEPLDRCTALQLDTNSQINININNYFIIKFDRLSNSGNNQTIIKKHDSIHCNKHITIDGKICKFKGCIIHSGTATGGHYRYLKYEKDNLIIYDDSHVYLANDSNKGRDEKRELLTNGIVYLYQKTDEQSTNDFIETLIDQKNVVTIIQPVHSQVKKPIIKSSSTSSSSTAPSSSSTAPSSSTKPTDSNDKNLKVLKFITTNLKLQNMPDTLDNVNAYDPNIKQTGFTIDTFKQSLGFELEYINYIDYDSSMVIDNSIISETWFNTYLYYGCILLIKTDTEWIACIVSLVNDTRKYMFSDNISKITGYTEYKPKIQNLKYKTIHIFQKRITPKNTDNNNNTSSSSHNNSSSNNSSNNSNNNTSSSSHNNSSSNNNNNTNNNTNTNSNNNISSSTSSNSNPLITLKPVPLPDINQPYSKEIKSIDQPKYDKLYTKIQTCNLTDLTTFPSIDEYLQVQQYINKK